VAEASRAYDLSPSEIEGWVDDAKRGMENALRENPLEIREQYEQQLKDLHLCGSLHKRLQGDRLVGAAIPLNGVSGSMSSSSSSCSSSSAFW
jgi:hypothetical protein